MADPVSIRMENAVTVGPVVNELAADAVRYAFPSREDRIEVGFRRHRDGVDLMVTDDGVG